MSAASDTRSVTGVKFSLRYKLIIGFFLVFSVPFLLAYYWFWQYSTQTALSRIEEDLRHTLDGTIRGIDGDQFEQLVRTALADDSGVPGQDPLYQAHQNWLMGVYWIQPKAYNTYTYIKGDGPDDVRWVGDNYRELFPDQENTKFLEPYTRTPDSMILEGFVQPTVNMTIYTDPWGSHVSAYGPIKNSKGYVVGAVGIDFRATEVSNVQRAINQAMLISGIIAIVVLFLIIYAVSNFLTTPIIKLAHAAQRVGEGDYNQDFTTLVRQNAQDEIDVLASNFAGMVSKVYSREQNLRKQVEELKIEIDEAKRSKQVDEIVDTDFFRDLQAKADRMRVRRSAAADGAPASGSSSAAGESERNE
ncbi:MAG: HAMP domain-containing protein [Chloroflexota bacterium]